MTPTPSALSVYLAAVGCLVAIGAGFFIVAIAAAALELVAPHLGLQLPAAIGALALLGLAVLALARRVAP